MPGAAEEGVDLLPDIREGQALAVEVRRRERLRHADAAVGRVGIHIAGEEALVAEVLLAVAVAIQGVQHLGDLLRCLIGPRDVAGEEGRREGRARLLPPRGFSGLREEVVAAPREGNEREGGNAEEEALAPPSPRRSCRRAGGLGTSRL